VRELQNVIERAVIVSPGDALRLDLGLPSRVPGRRPLVPRRGPAPGSEPVSEAEWKRQERQNLLAALQQAGGKIYGPGGAAELLGVKPTTLASRLKALGIKKPSKRWKKPA
jgi:transcriptional regulator with GAF, ATPase, and Fis domain